MTDGSSTPLKDKRYSVRKFKDNEDFEVIRQQFMGKSRDHCVKWRCEELYEDCSSFAHDLGANMEWKRAKDMCDYPMLVGEKPDRFHALQGKLGDCWLIAAMEAMTFNRDLFNHVVPVDQNFNYYYTGAFHFRIWRLGVWRDVVVDDRLPVNSEDGTLCYAHSRGGNIFWAALLEKAYAKCCASPGQEATYLSLELGIPLTSLQDLSGGIVERIFLDKPPPRGIELKYFMTKVFENKCMMCCNLKDDNPTDSNLGLHANHTYAITKVVLFPEDDPNYHGLCLVRVMNPWGEGEWRGDWSDDDYNMWRQLDEEARRVIGLEKRDDGEFWMQDSDFIKRFKNLCVCHLEPEEYAINHMLKIPLRPWRVLEVFGDWTKNNTAAGPDPLMRYKNPQYMFVFEKPDSDTFEPTDGCETLIDVTHRSKADINKRFNVAYYIYYGLQMPITWEDVQNNPPLEAHPDFSLSYGRSYAQSISLYPGNFIIIPCAQNVNAESRFLLRVFSQCNIEQETDQNTKISRPLSMEEQSVSESNAILERIFIDQARGSDEIDYIGLKNILQEAMNPTGYSYGIFMTFSKYIRDAFEANLFRSLFDEYKNEKVIFTKNECRCMIAMLNEDNSGKLNISEFYELWKQIYFWTKVYDQQRDEEEGYLKVPQLRDALGAIGYDVSKQTIHSLSCVYADGQGLICLTDFILCGVTLENALSIVEKADIKDKSKITFTLEQWVKNTLML